MKSITCIALAMCIANVAALPSGGYYPPQSHSQLRQHYRPMRQVKAYDPYTLDENEFQGDTQADEQQQQTPYKYTPNVEDDEDVETAPEQLDAEDDVAEPAARRPSPKTVDDAPLFEVADATPEPPVAEKPVSVPEKPAAPAAQPEAAAPAPAAQPPAPAAQPPAPVAPTTPVQSPAQTAAVEHTQPKLEEKFQDSSILGLIAKKCPGLSKPISQIIKGLFKGDICGKQETADASASA